MAGTVQGVHDNTQREARYNANGSRYCSKGRESTSLAVAGWLWVAENAHTPPQVMDEPDSTTQEVELLVQTRNVQGSAVSTTTHLQV